VDEPIKSTIAADVEAAVATEEDKEHKPFANSARARAADIDTLAGRAAPNHR